MPHDFKDSTDGDRNCQICGAGYHCPKCNEGCGMMGHHAKDVDGDFYYCQDKDRYEVLVETQRVIREMKEHREYLRLKTKYEKD